MKDNSGKAKKQTNKKEGVRNSIRSKLYRVAVLPLLLLTVVLAAVGYTSIRNTITEQTEDEMINQSKLVVHMYDRLYPGDFSVKVVSDSYYRLYKGGFDVTSSVGTLDVMKQAYDDEFTIFANGVGVLTTMCDDEGNRYILPEVAAVVQHDVLMTGKPKFYKNVIFKDQNYFAYFSPIVNSDGLIFGMTGVYRSAEQVNIRVMKTLLPVLLVYFVVTFIVGLVSVAYSKTITDRIMWLERFLGTIAGGRFDVELPTKCTGGNDEISSLSRSSLTMQSELSKLVEYDALTELYNRRYGDKRLKYVIENTNYKNSGFCVCIGDIDFFKKVNDTYGHDAGDEVLRVVARTLKKHMAGKGFVARWGGEEFLFVFERYAIDEAAAVLCEILEELRETVIVSGEFEIKVTMSYGVTPGWEGADTDSLLKEADNRLYYAKEHGRNQVISRDVSADEEAQEKSVVMTEEQRQQEIEKTLQQTQEQNG
ncbi:MAG: diguanylate cyclase [Lachnospiraceae bacterium]|nr:diguanylate cyclase [Lachnospiraceae bacterium]